MKLKNPFNKKNSNQELDSSDIENNEFYLDSSPKKNFYIRKIDKKVIIITAVIIIIIIASFVLINNLSKDDNHLFDLGNLLNQEAADKNEEQQGIHSLILRNAVWGSSMDDVALEERGNLIDYGKEYLTCDYETLFGVTWLPTYLFKDNKLVGIVYEANLSLENLDELSSIHQDVAVNIHYVYEQLYRENNKWATGQDRKYDKNLWTKALLNGKLTMQSVWNSSNEKVFLVTNNKSLFGFLEKQKGEAQKASMAFIIVSDDFLLKNDFDVLMDIKPSASQSGSYNANGENIEMTTPDDVNPNTQVDSTTNYTSTIHSEGLTDEEFEAIYNEINGNNSSDTLVDENGNPINKETGTTTGGTTMNSPSGDNGNSISNTQQNGSNNSSSSGGSNNSNSGNSSTSNNGNNGTNNSSSGNGNSNDNNYNGTSGNNNTGNNGGVDNSQNEYEDSSSDGKLENSTPVTETPTPENTQN